VDAQGRLVGIKTPPSSAAAAATRAFGFAVPINLASHVMETPHQRRGKVARGYLDISLQNLDAGLASQFNLPDQNGALVDDVTAGTPAEKAGLKSGMYRRLQRQGGQRRSQPDVVSGRMFPGSLATVKLLRNGHTNVVTVKLAGLPPAAEKKGKCPERLRHRQLKTDALNGVTVQDLNQASANSSECRMISRAR